MQLPLRPRRPRGTFLDCTLGSCRCRPVPPTSSSVTVNVRRFHHTSVQAFVPATTYKPVQVWQRFSLRYLRLDALALVCRTPVDRSDKYIRLLCQVFALSQQARVAILGFSHFRVFVRARPRASAYALVRTCHIPCSLGVRFRWAPNVRKNEMKNRSVKSRAAGRGRAEREPLPKDSSTWRKPHLPLCALTFA